MQDLVHLLWGKYECPTTLFESTDKISGTGLGGTDDRSKALSAWCTTDKTGTPPGTADWRTGALSGGAVLRTGAPSSGADCRIVAHFGEEPENSCTGPGESCRVQP